MLVLGARTAHRAVAPTRHSDSSPFGVYGVESGRFPCVAFAHLRVALGALVDLYSTRGIHVKICVAGVLVFERCSSCRSRHIDTHGA